MEEDLLKYFTGNGEPTTETITPINIKDGIISATTTNFASLLKTKDESYIIRYGGSFNAQRTNVIEVYNIGSVLSEEPIAIYTDIKINGHTFSITDMKEDNNGRFYALGFYYNNPNYEYYLILLNNFIQDGELVIRKYYTNTDMGFILDVGSGVDLNPLIIKKEDSAEYYMIFNRGFADSKIFKYKIDILQGNSLEEATISPLDTSSLPIKQNLYIIDNNIICPLAYKNNNGDIVCTNLLINTEESIDNKVYEFETIKTFTYSSNLIIDYEETDLTFKISYLVSNGNNYNLNVRIIDLQGNEKIYVYNNRTFASIDGLGLSYANNYIFITTGTELISLYYNIIGSNEIIEFHYNDNFTEKFRYPKIIKQFNLDAVLSILGSSLLSSDVAYVNNFYSKGYSSEPYYNNNFMIPQYLNLYSRTNDLMSIVYSRDVINRFYAGNQLTSTFNIPNYLLNDGTIHREIVNGQTNLSIEDNNKPYSKNRFESLYITYMYNMYVKDNTNEDNLINQEGSNRIANSVWNILDYNNSKLSKARITYEDGSQEILNLNITNITSNIKTFEYEVTGNIIKIEYLSQDENTVYATYRCNLTGTNTISQTIQVSST